MRRCLGAGPGIPGCACCCFCRGVLCARFYFFVPCSVSLLFVSLPPPVLYKEYFLSAAPASAAEVEEAEKVANEENANALLAEIEAEKEREREKLEASAKKKAKKKAKKAVEAPDLAAAAPAAAAAAPAPAPEEALPEEVADNSDGGEDDEMAMAMSMLK